MRNNITQKERQLLLQDLCARLPYGVKIHGPKENDDILWELDYNIDIRKIVDDGWLPYLRPMKSMTEEEKFIMNSLWIKNNELVFADSDEIRRYRFYDISVVDFLNSRHFDYRGLIERGLALPAKEGMYLAKRKEK